MLREKGSASDRSSLSCSAAFTRRLLQNDLAYKKPLAPLQSGNMCGKVQAERGDRMKYFAIIPGLFVVLGLIVVFATGGI
jgi:hypothetical protein